MRTVPHIIVGGLLAALPDAALLLAVKREWLPQEHPIIRAHHWLHQSPWGYVLAGLIGWGSHMVADRYTMHNIAPGVRARRGWKW